MSFSEKVQVEALVACGRCCCICHKFCGTKINLHHIVQKADGGDDSFENCIPLCLDCHEDMGKADPKHVTGKHYTERELIMHRDNWYSRVKQGNNNCDTSVCEEDKALFHQIRGCFDDELCDVLKEYDFGGMIPASFFTKLDWISRYAEKPNAEFVNVELEKLRAKLFGILYEFKCYLARNTFSRYIGDQKYTVPRLWLLKEGEIELRSRKADDLTDVVYFDDENVEHEFPDENVYEFFYTKYDAEAQKLNEYADQLWEAYTTFVRQGRRITQK